MTAIHQRLSALTPTERRIAQHVLDDPQSAVESSITQLAAACDTSIASIVRFTQSLGFSGYPELRLALATELDRRASDRERFNVSESDVSRHDDALTTVRKIAFAEASAIERTASQIDIDELERCVGAVRAARRAGLSVPGDVSIVGFDDSALMSCTEPPLTTVRQPIESMGRAVIALLLAQIAGTSRPSDELLFEPELVLRASTGPLA